jgi:hypothetical protein
MSPPVVGVADQVDKDVGEDKQFPKVPHTSSRVYTDRVQRKTDLKYLR